MILVDTSVWVAHLRRRDAHLVDLLEHQQVACHPFVMGEVGLGSLKARPQVLDLLGTLPQLQMAAHDEVMALVERRRLFATGLGWVDAHLLASAMLTQSQLWTLDRALATAARGLAVEASSS